MTGQMNENGVSTAGKRTQAQFRRFLVERNMSEQTIKAYSYAVKQFYGLYPQLTDKNLQLYKYFLLNVINHRLSTCGFVHELFCTLQGKLPVSGLYGTCAAERIFGTDHQSGRL